MTKKHFIAIAKVIKNERARYEGETDNIALNVLYGIELTTKAMCKEFRVINPLFDEARFLEACGLYGVSVLFSEKDTTRDTIATL